jgi:hypothetical protein
MLLPLEDRLLKLLSLSLPESLSEPEEDKELLLDALDDDDEE